VRGADTTGHKVGVLLLLQLAAALTLPFILARAVTVGSPAYLTAVAEDAVQVRAAVLLACVGAGLTVYLGITLFPVLRRHSKAAALLFVVACSVSCVLDVVQAGTMLSMLALSSRFVEAGAVDSEVYEVVGAAVASARRAAHAMQLLAVAAWMVVFYGSMLRFRLLPRVLAVLGLAGISLQFGGVTLMLLLGQPLLSKLAMPLLPVQLAVAGWLLLKGFQETTIVQAGEPR